MRLSVLIPIVLLCGCLSVKEPHNPMKRTKKPESASTAPVETSTSTTAPSAPQAPLELDSVALMKEMFLVQKDINQQILKMAEELSELELMELNLWLKQYGVQIQKRVRQQSHDPRRVF